MTSFEFSPSMRLALDAYHVPPLPEDFAELVVAKALASTRQRASAPLRTTRWRRAGRIVTGAALAGLLTATAAAAGWLGKPIYVPVISELIERIAPTKIEEQPLVVLPSATVSPMFEAPVNVETGLAEPVPPAPDSGPSAALELREPTIPVTAAPLAWPVATPAAAPIAAPNPAERAALRRDPIELSPQRALAPVQPPAADPVPAPRPAAIEPVAVPEPIVRPAPTPVRTAPAIPRDVRPTERVRTPTGTRPVRTTPSTSEQRRNLRERRIS